MLGKNWIARFLDLPYGDKHGLSDAFSLRLVTKPFIFSWTLSFTFCPVALVAIFSKILSSSLVKTRSVLSH